MLNSVGWSVPSFTISDTIGYVIGVLNIATLPVDIFMSICDDYKHYVLSEYEVFTTFNLFEISLAIVRLALYDVFNNSSCYISEYLSLLNKLELLDRVNKCELFIKEMLYGPVVEQPDNIEVSIEDITNQLVNI
jgi:hypothetical protein